jgi:hypothetical protein
MRLIEFFAQIEGTGRRDRESDQCSNRRSPDSITESQKKSNSSKAGPETTREASEHRLQRQAMQPIYVWRIPESVRGRRLVNELNVCAVGQVRLRMLADRSRDWSDERFWSRSGDVTQAAVIEEDN